MCVYHLHLNTQYIMYMCAYHLHLNTQCVFVKLKSQLKKSAVTCEFTSQSGYTMALSLLTHLRQIPPTARVDF